MPDQSKAEFTAKLEKIKGGHETVLIKDLKITSSRAKALAAALEQATTLKELYLSSNELGDDGVIILIKALEQHSSLRALELHNQEIGDDGAQVLAKHLGATSTLESLTLSTNGITDDGVEALALSLMTNTCLQTLNLSENELSDASCAILAQTIVHNMCLKQVTLEDNEDISEDGLSQVSDALKGPRYLISGPIPDLVMFWQCGSDTCGHVNTCFMQACAKCSTARLVVDQDNGSEGASVSIANAFMTRSFTLPGTFSPETGINALALNQTLAVRNPLRKTGQTLAALIVRYDSANADLKRFLETTFASKSQGLTLGMIDAKMDESMSMFKASVRELGRVAISMLTSGVRDAANARDRAIQTYVDAASRVESFLDLQTTAAESGPHPSQDQLGAAVAKAEALFEHIHVLVAECDRLNKLGGNSPLKMPPPRGCAGPSFGCPAVHH
jgi:hypothetical protein